MTDQTEKIDEIFWGALQITSSEQREAFLDQKCGEKSDLRALVEQLLRAQPKLEQFLEKPIEVSPPTLDQEPPIMEGPGTVIGPYKLLQQIGEGGMGVVFMAEQIEPLQRTVALKIIKPGMDTRQVIARFEAERQAVAMMDHPNIAKVLDAGTTDSGRPYFVMDLVKGVPITEYCDAQYLPVRKRLELMADVCHAVQHAHQKGIIHRDLKPSNVLVAEYDGKPVPKIIDFGVAKATAQRLTEKSMFTELGQMVGTVEYMSPEQARFNQLDIDTRSDIYSLGVLVYELLTGSTPFGRKRLNEAAFDEMLRIIREEEPPKPSTRLSSISLAEGAGERVPSDLASIAANRGLEPVKLNRLVQGELDWIVMKALEKDRNRRYETASSLAADIGHHLNDEPVAARPASSLYRFRKTVRRNKIAFASGGSVIAALVVGLGLSTWLFVRERAARQRAVAAERLAEIGKQKANTEAAKASAVSNVLLEMLDSANPDEVKGVDYTVRELLDGFSQGLSNQLVHQPEVEAEIRAAIGRAYGRLGFTQAAETNLRTALELRRRIFGPQHEKVAESLSKFAWHQFEQGRNEEAEKLSREALAMYQTRGVVGRPVINAYHHLLYSLISQHRWDEAESVSQEALARAREWQVEESEETARVLNGLGRLKYQQEKFAEGEELARRAVEIQRRVDGKHDGNTAWALRGLGSNLLGQRKYSEAETVFREALAIFRRYFNDEHKSTSYVLGDLRAVLIAAGDQAGLEALAREQIERAARETNRGEPYPYGRYHLGRAYADLKQWQLALDAYEQALALASEFHPGYRPGIAGSCLVLLREVEIDASLPEDDQTALIDKLAPRVNEFWSETISEPPTSPLRKTRLVWAVVTNPSEGFTGFHTAIELAQKAVAQEPNNAAYWNTLGVAHYRAGNFDDAIKALVKSTELREGDDCIAECFLAMAHWQLGQKDEARKWYEQAAECMEKNSPGNEELRRFRAEATELLGIAQTKPKSAPVQPADHPAKAEAPTTTSQ